MSNELCIITLVPDQPIAEREFRPKVGFAPVSRLSLGWGAACSFAATAFLHLTVQALDGPTRQTRP